MCYREGNYTQLSDNMMFNVWPEYNRLVPITSRQTIGLEQSWPQNPLISGSTRLAVCHEPILLTGLGK